MTEILHKKDIIAVMYITILTIVAVVYGFNIIPSPSKEKLMVADHKRVIDLGTIQAAIDDYYQNNSMLPQSLNELTYNANDPSTPLNKVDPQTHQPYEYFITSPTSYQLCALFLTNSAQDDTNAYDDAASDYSTYSSNFKHPAGHFCFTKTETSTDIPSPYEQLSPAPSTYFELSNTPTPFPINRQSNNNGGAGL